ncbi:MAG: replicative DNA helicase [Lachnospiraceae bacterium]
MEEAVIKRVMPHDDEAESSVIGAMLIDNEAIMVASELIKGEDFYQKQLGIVYNTMVELYSEGKPVEPVILHASLREKGMPEEVCGPDRILQWMNQTLTSANIKYYAEIVSEKSVARRLIRLNEEIANTCYAGSEKLEDTLAEAEKRVFDLVQRGGGNEFVPIRQVVINVMKKIDAASRARGRVTGLETGFMDLDYKTSGLQPSDLVLIAARPSMGKTAFVLNLAQHMAFKRNHAVAVFSLEMSKEQLVNRMLSLESHVDAQKIRTGRLTDEEWMNLVEGSANIANSKLIIDDTPGISLSLLRSKCRRLKIEHDIQIVIIDYLQLMSGDNNGSAASRQQEISDISRGLKALAREMNVPVVALSQLSRAVEQRPDHRPMLSDLRESGAIEQDADVVMFLYREGYYNRDLSEAQQRVAEVIIAKQRNGPIGTVNLLWMPELTKFSDMERSPEQ